MAKEYLEYTVNDPQFDTVGKLIGDPEFKDGAIGDPIFRNYQTSVKELLDYTPKQFIPTNRERIRSVYNTDADKSITDDASLPLYRGTVIYIPKSKLETFSEPLLFSLSLEDDGSDGSKFSAFISQTFQDLKDNPQYKSINKSKILGTYIDFYPQITVLLYSRVLEKVINLSPFVMTCSTNSNSTNSTFQISLPPILGKYSEETGWIIDEKSISDFSNGSSFLAYATLQKSDLKKEQNFYFEKVISQSDLIFIQYETLEMEAKDREKDNSRFFLGLEDLNTGDPENPKVYDLMGSVDSIDLSINPQNGIVDIGISGRDFTKFLIDDGSYFFYEELLGSLIPDLPKNEKIRGRLYGAFPTLNALGYRSIETQLGIIMRLFYTTGYYDDTLFDAWSNKNQYIKSNSKEFKTFEKISEGILEEANLSINLSRAEFGLILENKSQEKLATDSIFNEIVNRIETKTLSENGFLIPDAFNSLNGRLFDGEKLNGQNALQTNNVSSSIASVQNYIEYTKTKPSKISDPLPRDGVWGIFDIEVDPSIANILVSDNKLNEANGSILNSLKSMVEEPFMEIFTDTYSDRFKLIARRQPFDEVQYNDLFDNTVIDNTDRSLNVIDSENVISSSLSFNEDNIFTWFYLEPLGFTGAEATDGVKFAYVQAIMLNKYIEIWGSKPYYKKTNYSVFMTKRDVNAKITTNLRQAILDLKYMVDINAYNPFVRQGTITIIGDRTFKKKTAVYYKPTNEVYHIDAVQNNYVNSEGVDRTTTLQVSRGMVRDYMQTDKSNPDSISYFNIVKTEINEVDLNDTSAADFGARITQNWDVNPVVFDFFLKRKQFK